MRRQFLPRHGGVFAAERRRNVDRPQARISSRDLRVGDLLLPGHSPDGTVPNFRLGENGTVPFGCGLPKRSRAARFASRNWARSPA